MKKKALAIFLAALLASSAMACGKKKTQPLNPGESGSEPVTQVTPPAQTPTTPDVPTPPNPSAGLTLTATEKTLRVNDTYQIEATFIPEYDTDSKVLLYTVSDAAILSVDENGLVRALAEGEANVTVSNENKRFTATLKITVTDNTVPPLKDGPKPDHTEYLTVADSAIFQGNLVLVNKNHATPASSAASLVSIRQNTPSGHLKVSQYKFQLSSEALTALSLLAEDYYAAMDIEQPKDILVSDAHRTPEDQQNKIDQKTDDTSVGHSDFQTGLSVNLKFYDGTFTHFIGDNTVKAETQWLLQHYADYGFILRYPEGALDKTGYNSSVSHFRYVGVPHAAYIKANSLTLEEYVELLKQYNMDNPLKITVENTQYSVYYVATQGQTTTLPIPAFDRAVEYSISGNNVDGFIITVAAQWEEGSFNPDLPTPNENPGITLDVTDRTLTVGDTLTLNPIFVPLYNSDDKTLSYTSSDPTVATVENGVITTLKEGTAVITVSSADKKYTATCTVTVAKQAPKPNPNAGITLNENELALKTGDYFQLVATFVPEFDSDSRMLIFSVSGSAVTVDGTGKIFAKEVGSVTVTVKDISGKFTASCTVTVEKGMNINASLTLDKISIKLEEEKTEKITATFIPKYDTDDTKLIYKSSDSKILTVDDNGNITAIAPGSAVVTVKDATGEFSATCTVTVTPKPIVANPDAGITLDKTEIILSVDENATLLPNFTPEFATDSMMLIYSSSDPDVAVVDGLGKITARAPGIAVITVKNYTGKYTAECTVYVPDPNAGITLTDTELVMEEGSVHTLTVTFIPEYPTDSTVLSFKTSEESILTVDENGTLTAVGYGKATVTVTCGKYEATCEITVNEKPDPNAGITLEANELTLSEGDSAVVGATFVPVFDADDTTLTYTVSDESIITVDTEGNIIAVSPGIATVTIQNADKTFEAVLTITVNELPNLNAGITLFVTNTDLHPGDTTTASATVIPVYSTDDTAVTFTTSDSEVFTVDENGLITAIKAGTATLTATSGDLSTTVELTITPGLIVGEDTETGFGEFLPYE